MAGKFEIKRAKDGQFYFNLKARNGEIILTSETYTTKANAHNGIASVMTNALLDQRFERKTSRRDEPYFVLKAANGEPIGVSEMYSSPSAMENGIESVKHDCLATMRFIMEIARLCLLFPYISNQPASL